MRARCQPSFCGVPVDFFAPERYNTIRKHTTEKEGRTTEDLIIRRHIAKEEEGTYFAVPFEVPSGVETLSVSYTYPAAGHGLLKDLHPQNVVDLGLSDGAGAFLGWSGSARQSVFVGPYASSPGYLRQTVTPGTWRILVGAYHIQPQGADVTYTVRFTPPAARWYRGDLHMHSTASDGVFTAWELGTRAKKAGLDFIAVADHNNYSENLHLPSVPGLTYIPAVEWTHYKGHMNFFGVPAPFENSFIANTEEEMRALVADARAKGAAVSVNHPKCPFCPYLWDDDGFFDLMEVWNGPYTPRNARAVEWWFSLLKNGRRIPAVGGSDFHKPGQFCRIGSPVTAVYAPSPAAEDLLAAIRAGHAYVAAGVKGPHLELSYGGAMMGDEAVYSPDLPVTVKTDARSVEFFTDAGSAGRVPVKNGEAQFDAKGARFVFAKISSALIPGRLLAISNPIYFKEES